MKTKVIGLLIGMLGLFSLGYNLGWGELLPFHPDENNLVWAVERIDWFDNLNPKFFAYGSGPIYLASMIQVLFGLKARLVLRLISLGASLMGLWVIYKWLKAARVKKPLRLLVMLGTVLSVGIIQQSHFGTIDNLGAVLVVVGLYFSYQFYKKGLFKFYVLSLVFLGLAGSVKISFMYWVGWPVILAINKIRRNQNKLRYMIGLIMPGLVFVMLNPFAILDWGGFLNSMRYESGVALGKIVVFYTRQFQDVDKLRFILTSILFYTVNPVGVVLGFLSTVVLIIKKKWFWMGVMGLMIVPVMGWFVLWARFFTLWFWLGVVLIGVGGQKLDDIKNGLGKVGVGVWIMVSMVWAVGFLKATYWQTDARLEASKFLVDNIKKPVKILQEEGNVVNLPIKYGFETEVKMSTFNPYRLEEKDYYQKVINQLREADMIIVPSRRGWYNHMRLKNKYPQTAKFYADLFSGRLGFYKYYEVYRPFKFLIWDLKDEIGAEETFSVFDHPHIIILTKIN